MKQTILNAALLALCLLGSRLCLAQEAKEGFIINEQEYLEYRGVNVMLAHDFYPEGHQGGVSVIQNGLRVGTNGDLRLEPTPGQWQPVPKVGENRDVDRENNTISTRMSYPDPDKNRIGFNPVFYPDLEFTYHVRVQPAGKSFKIIVDLDEPLPEEWIGKVGFNFELFPGILFGKSYYMDDQFGIFTRQVNGPGYDAEEEEYQVEPLATGRKLTVAPETEHQRMTIENLKGNELQLIDGRGRHNNGWFVVRSLVPSGASTNAIEWLVTPHAIEGWQHDPVVQISQVGYHPNQQKIAVIERDANDNRNLQASLLRVKEDGGFETIKQEAPENWGKFLRYNYARLDFSDVNTPGMYVVRYDEYTTEPFQIGPDVFKRHVWQPTLEYFLPVQMCHMRINDRYKVWHGLCHMDDALMAPTDINHFDGYVQGPSTLTSYSPGEHVPGINIGGWHDAGDYDLRVESQASEIQILAHAFLEFGVDYDNTTVDQDTRVVEIHKPDGKSDILQQIEHGALSIVGGYNSLGRLYRGIISPGLRQYVHLGDAATMSDNQIFRPNGNTTASAGEQTTPAGRVLNELDRFSTTQYIEPEGPDDRWVFTEENPRREIGVAAGLAVAARALEGYNDELSQQCLRIARELFDNTVVENPLMKVEAATELLLATNDQQYADFLIGMRDEISSNIDQTGWIVGRTLPLINNRRYRNAITKAVQAYKLEIDEQEKKTPYGVPYEPDIWGAGWGIQSFGVKQYFLHSGYPEIFPPTYMLHAMNFVLGVHPGVNTASFASGVGSRSLTVAYGVNRDEWSYIPGGVGSGTALIRPDFPELLTWPYLWQQTEYVMGGGATDFMFLVLAADKILEEQQ